MRMVICDDERIQAELLQSYVEEYRLQHSIKMDVSLYASADSLYYDLDTFENLDILLLDIQMEGMNGMELAKRIRQRNENCVILFVTGVTEYIYDSFQVQALNYLLKPVKKDQLFHCLDQALEQLSEETRTITILEDKEVYKLKVSSILYAESDGHYMNIYCYKRCYRVKKSMKELEQELQLPQFYRLSRSYLLNLDAVDKITPKEVILSGCVVPMPRGKYRDVSQVFIQYHFKGDEHHE